MNHIHPPKQTRYNSRPSIGWMLVVQLQSSAIPVVLLLLLLLLWLPLPTNQSFMTGITPIHGFTVSVLVVSQRPTTVVTKRNKNAILPTATTVLRSTSSRTNNEVLVTSTSTIEPTGTVVDVPSYRSVIDDSHQENMKQERNMNQIWMFRNTFPISYDHYNRSTTSTTESSASTTTTTTTKILLLNGFGMGTFHQHRLMNEMMTHTNHHHHLELYAMDYLGQGQSWPTLNGPTEQQCLQYSAHTWMEQIIQFIEQVMLCVMADDNNNNNNNSNNKEISTKVHLVGNSLGGYLATYVAATRPDLIASLILLNATPIWGLDLPGWSGHLPVPLLPKRIGHFLFDVMRATNTIQQFLNITYVNDPTVYHPTLVHEIQSCTNGPFGHDAFASILWSPPLSIACVPMPLTNIATTTSTTNFYDCIEQVQCHVLLCYGQKDPWCKPAFAKQILQRLSQPPAPPGTSSPHHNMYHYVELSNVGHCPNHEAPIATAMVLTKWLQQQQQSQWTNQENINQCLFDGKQPVVVEETWGTTIVQERNANEIPLDWLDQIAVAML